MTSIGQEMETLNAEGDQRCVRIDKTSFNEFLWFFFSMNTFFLYFAFQTQILHMILKFWKGKKAPPETVAIQATWAAVAVVVVSRGSFMIAW